MQTTDKELRFAGDVSIDQCLIYTNSGLKQDIAAQVLAISIYEDIFSPFITGSLTVRESFDLANLFPFIGEEMLTIQISTPALEDKKNIKGSFYIYKMADRVLLSDKQVAYVLHFISPEAIVDLNKKISRGYEGKSHEIVSSVVKSNLNGLQSSKPVFAEETTKVLKFVSNYWSPIRLIQYCTEGAISTSGAPNYVFFENRYGFYFTSLDSLNKNGLYQAFTKDSYIRDSLPDGKDIRNITEDYRRIEEISIPVAYDYMDRIRSGMYASKIVSFDITKKQYKIKNYKLSGGSSQLNPNKMFSSSAISNASSLLINYPRSTANFTDFLDVSNYKHIQKRISLMQLAESSKIEITVPGRCDYTAGQKVSVTLNKVQPSDSNDDNDDLIDKMFSGFYLIGAVNHYITRERHECHMELIKDSLQIKVK
jgi:hypothetical protein